MSKWAWFWIGWLSSAATSAAFELKPWVVAIDVAGVLVFVAWEFYAAHHEDGETR